jgi:glutaredoxin
MNRTAATSTSFVLFTQRGCLSCDLMRVFLEAHEIVFEERNISDDPDARRAMQEQYKSETTPMLLIISGQVKSGQVKSGEVNSGEVKEVIVGFDPVRLDQLLDPAPSSDSVTES